MAKQTKPPTAGPADAPADLQGDSPAPSLTVEGAQALAAEVADVPKMEMATVSQLPPGMIPPPATVFHLPEPDKKHFYEVFPDMAPKAVEGTCPTVWVNADGTPYVPRQRRGGQFSAMVVEIANRWRKDLKRVIVVPMHTNPDEYKVKEYEVINKRVEAIFDFESDLIECMKAFGITAGDPLRAKLEAKGFKGAYDEPSTTPGMRAVL